MVICASLHVCLGEITKISGKMQHLILYGNVAIKSGAQHGQNLEIAIPYFKHAKLLDLQNYFNKIKYSQTFVHISL